MMCEHESIASMTVLHCVVCLLGCNQRFRKLPQACPWRTKLVVGGKYHTYAHPQHMKVVKHISTLDWFYIINYYTTLWSLSLGR
jgi:hypothetical protein